jgi:hypothetical protein
MIEALKSIIQGLTIQTECDGIKWLTSNQLSKIDKEHSFRENNDEKLDISLFLKLDKETLIQYHCNINHDHTINSSWVSIDNKKLQNGNVLISIRTFSEYKDLEDILYKKYIKPILDSYKLNYDTDVKVLEDIVSKCGIEAVRDFKINSILSEKDNRGFFGKLFN